MHDWMQARSERSQRKRRKPFVPARWCCSSVHAPRARHGPGYGAPCVRAALASPPEERTQKSAPAPGAPRAAWHATRQRRAALLSALTPHWSIATVDRQRDRAGPRAPSAIAISALLPVPKPLSRDSSIASFLRASELEKECPRLLENATARSERGDCPPQMAEFCGCCRVSTRYLCCPRAWWWPCHNARARCAGVSSHD